jgi:hypothetical protein
VYCCGLPSSPPTTLDQNWQYRQIGPQSLSPTGIDVTWVWLLWREFKAALLTACRRAGRGTWRYPLSANGTRRYSASPGGIRGSPAELIPGFRTTAGAPSCRYSYSRGPQPQTGRAGRRAGYGELPGICPEPGGAAVGPTPPLRTELRDTTPRNRNAE